jgi:hypothetical protein
MSKDKHDDMPMVPPPVDGEPPHGRPGGMPSEGPPPPPPFGGPEDVRGISTVVDVPSPDDVTPPGPPPSITSWKRFSRVFFGRKVVMISMIILVLLILMAIFAPWIAPFAPNELYTGDTLSQPSWGHWLGTDQLGRDTQNRVI